MVIFLNLLSLNLNFTEISRDTSCETAGKRLMKAENEAKITLKKYIETDD